MIFQYTHKQVMAGAKTQTRRLVQEGDYPIFDYDTKSIFAIHRKGRVIYQVGKTYAVQPGRSKPSVGRIKLLGIRRQRINEITEGDAKAEGVRVQPGHKFAPLEPNAVFRDYTPLDAFAALWDSANGKRPGCSWKDNPEVWTLEFELVT